MVEQQEFPQVYFGAVTNEPPPDWRKAPPELDPDDEVQGHTPEDVVAMLGFDPLEDEDELTEDELSELELRQLKAMSPLNAAMIESASEDSAV